MNDPEQTCEQCDGDLSEVAFCVPCWNKLGGEIISKGESVNTLTQKLESMTKHANEGWALANTRTKQWKDAELQVRDQKDLLDALNRLYSVVRYEHYGVCKMQGCGICLEVDRIGKVPQDTVKRKESAGECCCQPMGDGVKEFCPGCPVHAMHPKHED